MVISYYQRSMHVDRQYKYISHVENELNGLLGGPLVSREGKGYFSKTGVVKNDLDTNRPVFLWAIGIFYAVFFPVALTILAAFKFWGDWNRLNEKWNTPDRDLKLSIVNFLVCAALIVANSMYLGWKHRRKRKATAPTTPANSLPAPNAAP